MNRSMVLAVSAVAIAAAGAFLLDLLKEGQRVRFGRTVIELQICYAKCHTCDDVGRR